MNSPKANPLDSADLQEDRELESKAQFMVTVVCRRAEKMTSHPVLYWAHRGAQSCASEFFVTSPGVACHLFIVKTNAVLWMKKCTLAASACLLPILMNCLCNWAILYEFINITYCFITSLLPVFDYGNEWYLSNVTVPLLEYKFCNNFAFPATDKYVMSFNDNGSLMYCPPLL